MNLVERQTDKLGGPALDWAVAQIENEPVRFDGEFIRYVPGQFSDEAVYSPSADWVCAGPLIEKHRVALYPQTTGSWMTGIMRQNIPLIIADTPLLAICRAIVASRFGNTVQVPEELTQ